MTDLRLAGRAGALLLPFVLVIAACSGATASGAPSTAPGSSAGTGGPSAAPASQAPAATDGPSAAAPSLGALPSLGAIPSFDIGELTAGLAKLDLYRVSITIAGTEQVKGVVVTKPVLSRDLTLAGGTRVVVIGDEAWLGKTTGPLTAAPGSMAATMFAAYDPTLLVGMFSGIGWAENSLDKGTETKNGVSAKHYRVDGTTLAAGFSGLPAGATIDVWFATDKDYLVAAEATGFPNGALSIQVTGVDDPANKVERPS